MTTKTTIYKALIALTAIVATGCSDDLNICPDSQQQRPLELCASYPVASRANDSGFQDSDRMGIYVARYSGNTSCGIAPGSAATSNVAYTFDEGADIWRSDYTVYWPDARGKADIIGYYPYNNDIADPTAYTFTVNTRQDKSIAGMSGYESSDLLWAQACGVSASEGKVQLKFSHLLAGVTVNLTCGVGIDATAWDAAVKKVMLNDCAIAALVNLEDGSVITVPDNTANVVALDCGTMFRAVIVPQTLAAGCKLLTIDVDGSTYTVGIDNATTLVSGKMHTVNVTVDKHADTGTYTFTCAGISVNDWLDDPEVHDGIVRQYVTVNVSNPGGFMSVLEQNGLDYNTIQNLKVTGCLYGSDIMAIGKMPALTNLNIREVIIKKQDGEEWESHQPNAIPANAFYGSNLKHLILPESLKLIQDRAFAGAPIVGTVIFPEGLEEIGSYAFHGAEGFKAIFPSTLKKIGDDTFYSALIGELQLPEGLEEIGSYAFFDCSFWSQLILPESLTTIGESAFSHSRFSGDLIIPSKVKHLNKNVFNCCSGFNGRLVLNEGLESVGAYAFNGCDFCGELNIPSTVKSIGIEAFRFNRITSLSLPENLNALGERAFEFCQFLSGEIKIPNNIHIIPNNCFYITEGHISSIVLPKNLEAIHEGAFAGNEFLTTIICENPEPPNLADSAFDGVQKGNLTLEVPKEGFDLYRYAKGWRDFNRISEYRNFVCRPANVCALNSTRRQSATLYADGEWEVESAPSWVTVSPSSGNLKTLVTLTVNALGKGSDMRDGKVVFKLKDSDVRTYCNVSQYDYQYAEDEILTLQSHTRGRGITLYMVGDGWNAEDLSSGSYLSLCQQYMSHFFSIPPYDRLREFFDVKVLMALSQERGINTISQTVDTKFMSRYSQGDALSIEGIIVDDNAIYDYIQTLTGLSRGTWYHQGDMWRNLVILIPNTYEYPSETYIYGDGSTISVCPPTDAAYPYDTRGIVQHEAGGHGFGKLADESVTRNAYIDQKAIDEIDAYKMCGYYANISLSGSIHDVGWSKFIFDSRYSAFVDVFEGAYGFTRKVYRSETNSCMNYPIPYYNTISRYDITKRVFDYAEEPFDEKRDFYDVDTFDWGPTSAQ